MRYCGPRGLALDEFLRWPQESQDAALEWQAYESRRCNRCGYHPEEHRNGVHTHADICPGCASRAKASKSEASKEDGSVLVLAPGSIGTCQRCTAEHQANLAIPPKAAGPRGRHR